MTKEMCCFKCTRIYLTSDAHRQRMSERWRLFPATEDIDATMTGMKEKLLLGHET